MLPFECESKFVVLPGRRAWARTRTRVRSSRSGSACVRSSRSSRAISARPGSRLSWFGSAICPLYERVARIPDRPGSARRRAVHEPNVGPRGHALSGEAPGGAAPPARGSRIRRRRRRCGPAAGCCSRSSPAGRPHTPARRHGGRAPSPARSRLRPRRSRLCTRRAPARRSAHPAWEPARGRGAGWPALSGRRRRTRFDPAPSRRRSRAGPRPERRPAIATTRATRRPARGGPAGSRFGSLRVRGLQARGCPRAPSSPRAPATSRRRRFWLGGPLVLGWGLRFGRGLRRVRSLGVRGSASEGSASGSASGAAAGSSTSRCGGPATGLEGDHVATPSARLRSQRVSVCSLRASSAWLNSSPAAAALRSDARSAGDS